MANTSGSLPTPVEQVPMMDALLNLTMVTAPAAGASERKRTKFKSDLKDKQKLFAEALNELLVINPDFDQKKVSNVAKKHVRGEKRKLEQI